MTDAQTLPLIPTPRTVPGRAAELLAVLEGRSSSARLVYQPLVDIQQGQTVGYEALARFGTRISSSPTPWFTTAAKIQQSAELEGLLVRMALGGRVALPARRFLSVNVRPDLLASLPVTAAFESAGDLEGVTIELTEQLEFGPSHILRKQLDALRERGARLALDDVGAGWAGLQQISELRPDIVKLDRSLVTAADRDEVKLALVEMLLNLCSRLGSQLLVEGVETTEELDAFVRLGVPLAQGWVFGKPAVIPPRIDDDLSVRLKFLAGMTRRGEQVARVIDVTTMRGTQPPTEQQWHAAQDAQLYVVLDDDGRPTELYSRDQDDVVTRHSPVLTALASEDLEQALLRAMTRPPASRFTPLAGVDRAGRYVGTVRVDALVRSVLRR